MKHTDFVHLHVHSQYSLLDGACRLGDLLDKAIEYRMPALAVTDHGNMFGAVEFYQLALHKGIKPIIGCEVYVAPKGRFDRNSSAGDAAHHLVLLVKDETGYHNLTRLVTAGYFEGFYYKPRVDKELLAQHSQGLIALSACLKGEISQLLLTQQHDRAMQVAKEFKDIWGNDFYLEIQQNGIPEQTELNKELIKLSQQMDIPLVASNDCHYLRKEDAYAHEILLCIQTGKTINDSQRMRFSTSELYFKSSELMHQMFSETPQAVTNTIEIAQRCNLELEFNQLHLPHYQVPEGYDLDSYLEKLALDGLQKRYPNLNINDKDDPVVKRLTHELGVIRNMRYSGYFLIVWDFISFARQRKIAVGPGRGSAAGSLVAYALQITDIDPLNHNLLFERFLNPERISMPDIDIDFCMERRDEVISYVGQKYGQQNVAQIITFGTMAARGVIRDVGRALDMSYAEVDKLAKTIPNILNITLTEAIKQEEKLQQLQKSNPKISQLLDIAKTLEGLTRHASTHAAGIVITPKPLLEYVPLYKGPKGEVMTQYPMGILEKIGLLKMDFLGLRTLTVIENTLNFIRQARRQELILAEITMDDAATFKLLADGQTVGVFQLESSGMRDLLRRLKPECFADLVALVALFRPGPLCSVMVDDFIKRKAGKTPIKYDHPLLEPILKETYGVMVYQEQVMQIASTLAGFSLGEADILRRAMGKKKAAEMDSQRKKFIAGAKDRKIKPARAEKIFDLMAHFSGYGFNKSHSAAYAMISYQTAYLKTHYAVEFMAALLTSEMDNTDKIVKYISECREMSISILPPDVNESYQRFTVVGDSIRFGLAAVKNVGESAVTEIINSREEARRFDSIYEFCRQVDLRSVNRRVIESLIKCGAFDSTGAYRSQLLEVLDQAIEVGQSLQQDKLHGQTNLFDILEQGQESAPSYAELPAIEEWPENQLLTAEKEVIGFYITGHPLARYETEIKHYATCSSAEIANRTDGDQVSLAGLVTGVKEIKTRNGEPMGFVNLEDLVGFSEITILPDVYKTASHLLVSDSPILVKGEKYTKDEAAKIRAQEVFPLNEVRQRLTKKVHIKILVPGLTEENLETLRQELNNYQGSCPVLLHFLTPKQQEVTLAAGPGFKITPSEKLVAKIEQLFGKNTVYFE